MNEKVLRKTIINAIGGITISDILDFSVGNSFSSSFKMNSLRSRRELLFDVQNNADELKASYDIHTFSSAHDTNYFISVLEASVESGQFINLIKFYSLKNNISTFEDMVSTSIVCTSKLVPSVHPSPSSPFPTTINSNSILYNASSIPSMYTSDIPTNSPSVHSSNSPISNSLSPSTGISTSFNNSSMPTIVPSIAPSKAPHVRPSYKPSTALSIAPSVRPGDPTLTPTGEMMIVLVNRLIVIL